VRSLCELLRRPLQQVEQRRLENWRCVLDGVWMAGGVDVDQVRSQVMLKLDVLAARICFCRMELQGGERGAALLAAASLPRSLLLHAATPGMGAVSCESCAGSCWHGKESNSNPWSRGWIAPGIPWMHVAAVLHVRGSFEGYLVTRGKLDMSSRGLDQPAARGCCIEMACLSIWCACSSDMGT
jgi:hypothetical protein